ncbi:MAG: nucleotidyl transferase AbiEii/AbiGii toxin family protein [Candidatus Beckwithbacteria bacterium]
MISPQQLKDLSKKYKINESIVAREFVQISFLKEFYRQNFTKDIFFKGGTAIRLLYQGQRFSEDLDFTVSLTPDVFEKKITAFFSSLENQYPFSFKPRKTLAGKTYLLTAKVPYVKSMVFVKLDFSMRENVLEPKRAILETEYPIVMRGFVNALSKNEILAEKVRAVLKRKKNRDLYDLWLLQELGVKFNVELIKKKLEFYEEDFDMKILKKRLELFSKEEFVLDLRPFVPINERGRLGELFDFIIVYLKKKLVG